LSDQIEVAERRVRESKTEGREGIDQVKEQISALEESNRVLAHEIMTMKGAVEDKVARDEESGVRGSLDEIEDEEDLKIEREWVESEQALQARHDEVKAQLDGVHNSTPSAEPS
jgi:hypothetical protein